MAFPIHRGNLDGRLIHPSASGAGLFRSPSHWLFEIRRQRRFNFERQTLFFDFQRLDSITVSACSGDFVGLSCVSVTADSA